MPNTTHCGLSISMCRASSSSSSGKTGASLSTVVSRLTVETVTSNRNAVSTNEHLLTGLQCKIDVPNGIKMAARAQSTTAWWNRRPWLHLREKCILLLIKKAVHTQTLSIWFYEIQVLKDNVSYTKPSLTQKKVKSHVIKSFSMNFFQIVFCVKQNQLKTNGKICRIRYIQNMNYFVTTT